MGSRARIVAAVVLLACMIIGLPMEEFWSLVICVFAFAFLLSESIAYCERRVEYYAGNR